MVNGAGEANFVNGKTNSLNNFSGHYQPTNDQLASVAGVLRGNGLTTPDLQVYGK
jgi:hypothetical protein